MFKQPTSTTITLSLLRLSHVALYLVSLSLSSTVFAPSPAGSLHTGRIWITYFGFSKLYLLSSVSLPYQYATPPLFSASPLLIATLQALICHPRLAFTRIYTPHCRCFLLCCNCCLDFCYIYVVIFLFSDLMLVPTYPQFWMQVVFGTIWPRHSCEGLPEKLIYNDFWIAYIRCVLWELLTHSSDLHTNEMSREYL